MVRPRVSATTSAAHQPGPSSTTVRQQPFTAMESPTRLPSMTVTASNTRRAPSLDANVPSSSTSPVNIPSSRYDTVGLCGQQIDTNIRAQALQGADTAPPGPGQGRRARPGEQGQAVIAAQEDRRQVQHVLVDQPAPVKRPGHVGSALDQELDDAAAGQIVEEWLQLPNVDEGR